jgi:uncharacterized protein YecE (DUF72 family)
MAIRVGIGGWNYEPWRGSFYPPGLSQKQELHHASRQVTAIEINATYYRTQSPASFARWRDETPDGFVFSLKANRFATNRRVLAEAGESIQFFLKSGIAELGDKLGPIVWQFAPTKRFDADDFGSFLALLPGSQDGIALTHVLEVRHESFRCGEFVELAARHRCPAVYTDSPEFPSFADPTGDLFYGRLMNAQARYKGGYAPSSLARWAEDAKELARGGLPVSLPRVVPDGAAPGRPRDVYIFFINGAKERAPAAAVGLIERLGK